MKLSKYLHSCILLEEAGRRLLIDPGAFSFIEGKLRPEDIGPVDGVLITHKHIDHLDPKAIRYFAENGAKVFGAADIAEVLKNENIPCEAVMKKFEYAGFSIEPVEAKHELIPTEVPHNFAYLINGTMLHPGDSVSIPEHIQCSVFAMPVAGPWLRLIDSLELAKRLKPQMVIPIHDAIIKDFMLERIYMMCETYLKKEGIRFEPLRLGGVSEV